MSTAGRSALLKNCCENNHFDLETLYRFGSFYVIIRTLILLVPSLKVKLNVFHIYVCVRSIPCIIFALLFSISLLVVTQIRGHIAGSSPPPLPTTVCALHFYRGKISALSSLVDSRRIEM